MAEPKFYDGTKLLSMLDINGNKPEVYLACSNRSAGKTTFYGRYLVNRFLKHGEKFAVLYRFNYQLMGCEEKFFKNIGKLFFPGKYMRSERRENGIYYNLYLCDKSSDDKTGTLCGYALTINNADAIRNLSGYFSDVTRIFFDEFQSESGHYCDNEMTKFNSLHVTIARGEGKQNRYVPVYMCSNSVSLLNPYFVALGVSSRLRSDTKYLRGDGFVLEQNWNESAANAQHESAFNRAFASGAGNNYLGYAAQNVYLSDNTAFIEPPTGKTVYIATLRYKGKDYALRECTDRGIIYCDDRADATFPKRLAVTTDDMQINYLALKHNMMFVSNLRYFFERGCLRFKDLMCKEAVMNCVSY